MKRVRLALSLVFVATAWFAAGPQVSSGLALPVPCGDQCAPSSVPSPRVTTPLVVPVAVLASDESLARRSRSCAGCSWTVAPSCRTPQPDQEMLCVNAIRSCPKPGIRMAIWVQTPTDSVPRRVREFCRTPGEPAVSIGSVSASATGSARPKHA